MPVTRTDPTVPASDPAFAYRPASRTDIGARFDRQQHLAAGDGRAQPTRDLFLSALAVQADQVDVLPLRACELCTNRTDARWDGELVSCCSAPKVVAIDGLRPVGLARARTGACGPDARHLHMTSWGPQ